MSFNLRAIAIAITLMAVLNAPAFAQPATPAAVPPARPVSFQRDIGPLLSNICSACHGPDAKARKANLRLDTREGLLRTIVPGKPLQSALYQRLKQTGPGQMPPPDFLRRPTAQQIDLVEQWIAQGGKWEQHWAYAPVSAPAVPVIASPWPNKADKKRGIRPLTPNSGGAGQRKPSILPQNWGPGGAYSTLWKSEIDRFLLARMKRAGMTPAAPADRRTLLRRLTFDLTGLPPTYDEVRQFAADRSPDAYPKAVDRLLASERFGERMAVYWLDLVRYADTRGYHGDQNQDVSPYRDYVIQAFNADMPFDRFTREQLAGDLLPNATQDQKIASGYNKLLMTTEEGGAQAKEYMAKYAADRVRNVSAVWLGSTMGCCECHDHKYDPFTARDFYSMAAFFADVKQTAVGGLDVTSLPTPDEAAKIADLTGRIAPLQKVLDTQTPELAAAQAEWEKAAAPTLKKPENIAALLAVEPAKRTPKQTRDLAAYFRSIAPELAAPRAERDRLQAQLNDVNSRVRKTMETTHVEPAVMRILPRGNWLDESGQVVTPALPAFLDQLDTPSRRANRLDLAEWLTSKRNPLTARVMVNRFWALLFGRGLSSSLEDFGAQGAPPSQPELLDWLAADYRDHGWDTKRLIREIVLSAAYCQSSVPPAAVLKRDPANDLFARQGRHRLDAEFVRDNALAVSGLLVNRLGGASAKPYQPAHYWDYLNFPMRTWAADKGDDQYRRGLYTYWCRTYLQPSLLAFDAPTREECCSGRVISNTPQQALVLLNDPTYVEAARALAERVLLEDAGPARRAARTASTTSTASTHPEPNAGPAPRNAQTAVGADPTARIQAAYHLALQRDATAREVQTLLRVYARQKAEYAAAPAEAAALLKTGDHVPDSKLDARDLAAFTAVTRVILNLHESITRN